MATLLTRPFSSSERLSDHHVEDAQAGSFLAWLVLATEAGQLIIAGGPIAVGFVGGDTTAVSIFFTSFALSRGPVTSAYNLVARVLPDFTELAHGSSPGALWDWSAHITAGGFIVATASAVGSGLLLRPIVEIIYGVECSPPLLMATSGGAGGGLGLGALFATQLYSAAASGKYLAIAWSVALLATLLVLAIVNIEPIDRVAVAFVVGEGTGLVMLGLVLPRWARHGVG